MRYDIKKVWNTLLFFTLIFFSIEQANAQTSNYKVSVLTCGVGDELYASFGHSAIRIVDSAKGTDWVYNYGTFNAADPEFYTKFVKGKLLYLRAGKTLGERAGFTFRFRANGANN
jgi:hypothetical protein